MTAPDHVEQRRAFRRLFADLPGWAPKAAATLLFVAGVVGVATGGDGSSGVGVALLAAAGGLAWLSGWADVDACPQCGDRVEPKRQGYCAECGAALDGLPTFDGDGPGDVDDELTAEVVARLGQFGSTGAIARDLDRYLDDDVEREDVEQVVDAYGLPSPDGFDVGAVDLGDVDDDDPLALEVARRLQEFDSLEAIAQDLDEAVSRSRLEQLLVENDLPAPGDVGADPSQQPGDGKAAATDGGDQA